MSEAELKQALSECFDQIDKDKSGTLDSTEIFEVLKQFNDSAHCKCKKSPGDLKKDVDDFIKEVDKNKDNKIAKDEFLSFFIKLLT